MYSLIIIDDSLYYCLAELPKEKPSLWSKTKTIDRNYIYIPYEDTYPGLSGLYLLIWCLETAVKRGLNYKNYFRLGTTRYANWFQW